jgi:hypothetical protein
MEALKEATPSTAQWAAKVAAMCQKDKNEIFFERGIKKLLENNDFSMPQ